MKRAWSIILGSVFLLVPFTGVVHSAVVVCQHASWSAYRSPPGNFSPSLLDPNLCTHGVYAFAQLDPDTDKMLPGDPYTDLDAEGWLGGYKKFVALKNENPEFKAMIALGGANSNHRQFAMIAADPVRRVNFVADVLSFLKEHGFDGLEFDWLYPAGTEDEQNFAILLAEIRQAFEPEGLLLTASVSSTYIMASLGLLEIQESADFLVMMTYEYYGPWWLNTQIHAAFYRVQETTQIYLDRGVYPSKLVLSVPAYGHTYTLFDENIPNPGVGLWASGPGNAGPYSRTPGFLTFHEINTTLDSWTVVWDDNSQTPFAFSGDQWVSFDDERSTEVKMEYAKSLGLAGGAVWTVGDDNFENNNFPILRTMHTTLMK